MIFGRRYRLTMSLPVYQMHRGDEVAYSGSIMRPTRGDLCALMQHAQTGHTGRTDRDTRFLFHIGGQFSCDHPPERSPGPDTAERLDRALSYWMVPVEEGG